jgi:hypothetical protein
MKVVYHLQNGVSKKKGCKLAADPKKVAALNQEQLLALVLGQFDRTTDTEDEKASMVFLKSTPVNDLKLLIKKIKWSVLSSELGAKRTAWLRSITGDLSGYSITDGNAVDIACEISLQEKWLSNFSLSDKIKMIHALFKGNTSEEQGDAVMRIFYSMTVSEIKTAVRELTWEDLESELDDKDLIYLRKRTLDLKGVNLIDWDTDEITATFGDDKEIWSKLTCSQRCNLLKQLMTEIRVRMKNILQVLSYDHKTAQKMR